MYMYMRRCAIRLLIPTSEHNLSVPTWTDVAFAYVRELHKSADKLAGQVRIITADMSATDLRVESRWHPYAEWFTGICPRPGVVDGRYIPTFVNLVIGAGDLVGGLHTPGSWNLVITGYGIPPYKLNWLSSAVEKYHGRYAPSEKHAREIDKLLQCAHTFTRAIKPSDGVPELVTAINRFLGNCIPEDQRVYE